MGHPSLLSSRLECLPTSWCGFLLVASGFVLVGGCTGSGGTTGGTGGNSVKTGVTVTGGTTSTSTATDATTTNATTTTGSGGCGDTTSNDAHCGDCATACQGAQHCVDSTCVSSKIEHVVLIVEENHTFDAYFGHYCTAPAGSNPACTTGRACCEGSPATEPHGASPIVLDDSSNFATDRDHARVCEEQEIDNGTMDEFVTGATGADTCFGSGPSCSSQNNFAIAEQATLGPYWLLADQNALADRWFQPTAGGTASNNMYFAISHWQFSNNEKLPNTVGTPYGCLQGECLTGSEITYTGRKTIADLLLDSGHTFTVYADGYADAKAANGCESVPSDCTYSSFTHPVAAQACKFDASDIPFTYYQRFADGTDITDFSQLAVDIAQSKLPSFAYIKAREFHNEHPNVSNISDGIKFVQAAIEQIEGSQYASNTVVFLTWDEGGGFFDHVAPPPSIDTDDMGAPVPYGTRVGLLAIGPLARHGEISHVVMEHSSIVRFLEYNFLGPTGQLGYNDGKVANVGSLLDPTMTGIHVPVD